MSLYSVQLQVDKLIKQVKCLRCDVNELEQGGSGEECCTELQGQIDNINLQIIQINEELDALGGGVDLTALQEQVDDLQAELDATQASLITSTIQGNVNTYADLPSAAANTGEYWAVLTSTGTSWLPGSLGGTYRSQGIYYSDGVTWSFMGTFPYEATQVQVDAGLANDVFVTPLTLENADKWNDYLSEVDATSLYQPLNGNLTDISGLSGSSGFLTTDGIGGWAVDPNIYASELSEKGEIINEDWANLTDWTTSGVWSVGGNLLNIPNGTTAYTSFIRNSGFGNTKLRKWTAQINDYIIPTISASTYGISFGMRSQSHAGALNNYYVRFCTDSTLKGYIQIYVGSSHALIATSETFLPISSGDTTSINIKRIKNSLIIKWRNETTDNFLSYRHEMASNSSVGKPPNLSQFAIVAHGGATTMGSLIIDSNELMGAKFAIVTDSTGTSTSTNILESWTEILENVTREKVILFSGNGDRIDDNNWAEVVSYNPENIIVSCFSNNVSTGDSTASLLTKVADVITTLSGYGYVYGTNLFFSNIMNRNDVDVTAHNTALEGVYADMIDIATTFKDTADTGINPTKSDDGIHVNAEGHQDYAMLVASYLFEKNLISLAESPKPYFRPAYYQNNKIRLGSYSETVPENTVEIGGSSDNSQLRMFADTSIYGAYLGSIGANSLDLFGGFARKNGTYVSRQTSGSGIWMSSGGINFIARSGMTIDATANITNSATTWKGGLDSTGKWTFSSQGSGVVVFDSGTSATRGLDIHQSNNTSAGAQLIISKNRSGSLTGVGAVVNGDTVGTIAFSPSDGTSLLQTVKIVGLSNGTVATGSVPTDLVLYTGSNSSPTERMRISSAGAITFNNNTISAAIWQGAAIADAYISSASTWNAKQDALSGTGIVKSTAGTISYLTDNSSNWNTAYGWGDHSLEGYLTAETDPKRVVSLAFSGTTTKTLTLTLADATTVSSTFTDLTAGGGSSYSVVTVTGATHNETATSGEVIIRCDTTSNNITINLPTAVGNTAKITIKRVS